MRFDLIKTRTGYRGIVRNGTVDIAATVSTYHDRTAARWATFALWRACQG